MHNGRVLHSKTIYILSNIKTMFCTSNPRDVMLIVSS